MAFSRQVASLYMVSSRLPGATRREAVATDINKAGALLTSVAPPLLPVETPHKSLGIN